VKGPLCRLCESEHWPREPHKWKGVEPTACADCVAKDARIANLVAQVARLEQEIVTRNLSRVTASVTKPVTNGNGAEVTRNHVPKRDRAEYMRKRRALAKCSN